MLFFWIHNFSWSRSGEIELRGKLLCPNRETNRLSTCETLNWYWVTGVDHWYSKLIANKRNWVYDTDVLNNYLYSTNCQSKIGIIRCRNLQFARFCCVYVCVIVSLKQYSHVVHTACPWSAGFTLSCALSISDSSLFPLQLSSSRDVVRQTIPWFRRFRIRSYKKLDSGKH